MACYYSRFLLTITWQYRERSDSFRLLVGFPFSLSLFLALWSLKKKKKKVPTCSLHFDRPSVFPSMTSREILLDKSAFHTDVPVRLWVRVSVYACSSRKQNGGNFFPFVITFSLLENWIVGKKNVRRCWILEYRMVGMVCFHERI